MSAAAQQFSRFPSTPVEALADLDAVLDWTAKPAVQHSLSSVLAAEAGAAARIAGNKARAEVPASPSGPLAGAATTSGGTSGNTSGAAGASALERGARSAKRASVDADTPSESEEEEEEDPSDDGAAARRRRPRRSTRLTTGGGQALKPTEKRRVGRPIEYYGDADAPNLTSAERRRIRRRIANRESARRVRSRRLGELEEAQKAVQGLQENCKDLRQHTAASEAQRAGLEAEAGEMDARWHAAMAETARLRTELQRLRSMFQASTGPIAAGGRAAAGVAAPAAPPAAEPAGVAEMETMETASTGELAEALGAPRAPAADAKACGAARSGSDLLLDNNACSAGDAFGQPYNGFLVCA